jgi:hypothetical protein
MEFYFILKYIIDHGLTCLLRCTTFYFCSVPLDCVLLPTLANLLVFIAHPSSLVLPVAKLNVGEIAEAHNVRPNDIYIRFKKEICCVSFFLPYLFTC